MRQDSGYGRFGGKAATAEFTELRWITIQPGHRPLSVLIVIPQAARSSLSPLAGRGLG